MKDNKRVKVPVYVSDFLDEFKSKGVNLISIIDELVDIHEYYYNSNVYYEDTYRKAMIADWVEKVIKGDDSYDNLFLLLSEIHKNGYEKEESERVFVVYDNTEEEFKDEDFGCSSIDDSIKFRTKEKAIEFILKYIEVKEIYVK